MSAEPPPQQIVAVALVVDSSLALAQEWPRPLFEYFAQCLKRLSDSNPGSVLRLAFVGYGTADTVPSPILCKRFFIDSSLVYTEMTETPSHFGIGKTNSGGSRGMAALEGLVATLELFDILQNSPSGKSLVCHIIHIAASPPDNAKYPSWNDTMALDDVDWDLLPQEIKKRNIQYSTINLKPGLSRFHELHAALNSGPSAPWFNVRSTYTVLVAPLVALQSSKATSTKRQGETPNVERSPETKRPRLQANTDTPKVTPKAAAPQTQPPPSTVPNVQPPRHIKNASSQSFPTTTNPVTPRFNYQQLMDRFRISSEGMQKLEAEMVNAKAEGNIEKMQSLMREYPAKKEMHTKISQIIAHQAQSQQLLAAKQAQAAKAQAAANLSQNQAQLTKEAVAPPFPLNNGSPSMSTGSMPPASSSSSVGLDMRNAAHVQHSRSLSGSAFQPNTPNVNPGMPNASSPNAPANLTLQMQKMIEQQHRSRLAHSHTMGGLPNQNSPSGTGPPGMSATPGNVQSPQRHPEQRMNANPMTHIWSGSFNYSGTGPAGKKEIRIFVFALSSNPNEARGSTWPQSMVLVPTRETPFSMLDLQAWMKRHKPPICVFQVQPHVSDPQTNQENYDHLLQLLVANKIFATAAWTTPTGGQTKNILFFPLNQMGLAAAVFPLTGLPELPKAMPVPVNPKPTGISANMVAQFTPEQRQTFYARMVQQQRQQQMIQQQQQQQMSQTQDGSGMTPFNPNAHPGPSHSNMNTALNMMSNQGQGGQMMNMNPPQSSLPAGMSRPPGGVPGLSYEMLQSFMQRNAENGMNMNSNG